MASRARRAIFEALKAAAAGAFDEEMRRNFLTEGANLALADLDMDSLARMEFCISIELATGVTLLPQELLDLATTNAVERCIEAKLAEAAGGAK